MSAPTAMHPEAPAPWVRVARSLAIAAMLTCIAVAVAQLAQAINPAFPGAIWVGLIFVISLESMHSYRLLLARGVAARDRGRFRFVEWVVILLVVRFILYIGRPAGTLAAEVAAWSEDLARFFDLGFVLAAALVACFWAAALLLAQAFTKLDAAAFELYRPSSDLERYLWQTMPRHGRQDRGALLRQISAAFLAGGMLMIILVGLARVNISEVLSFQHARTSGLILNVLLYFVIGLLLISQAHYAALKAGWDVERLPVWDQIGKRWLGAVLAFLLLVAVLAALLPVGYSVGLLATVSTVVSWLWYILMQVVTVIVFMVGLIVNLFAKLFKGTSVDTTLTLQSPPELPTEAAAAAGSPVAWWPLVRSLLFWGALLAIVGYSLLVFVRDRWGLFKGWSLGKWLARLRGLFGTAQHGLEEAAQRLREGVLRWRASRARAQREGEARFLAIGRLSARDRVRYFYLSTVRRARDAGISRRPEQTPIEFEQALLAAAPEPESVATLTDAFVAARYSPAEVTADEAQRAKGAWQRLKRGLVRRMRGGRA